MDREGVANVRRAELLARLNALERAIVDQQGRVQRMHEKGWNAELAETRLLALKESQKLYVSVLLNVLGGDFNVDETVAEGGLPSWLVPK